jgi:hypothetical protein
MFGPKDKERLFVSMNGASGRIGEYSETGQEIAHWDIMDTLGGVDIDVAKHTVYIAAAISRQIYSLTLTGNDRVDAAASFKSFRTIKEAKTLGPLVFGGGKIYVADPLTGDVYALDSSQAERTTAKVAAGCGQPLSLRVDRQDVPTLLLIADAAGRRMLSLKLGIGNSTPKLFTDVGLF